MKAVILAGGGGTRLWPLSTQEKPKQFQCLTSDKTMLEETVERLDFLKPEDIYIAINEDHLAFTQELCPQISRKNIIIEPALRDTASCIGFAAGIIEKRHPGEVMCVIYADHLIKNKKEFQEKLEEAAEIAKKEETLNIVEVTAKEPNTNYGYVKIKNELSPNVFELDSFKEKPDIETAEEFIKSGDYLWNTGMYVWKAKTLLSHYEKLQPEAHSKILMMMEAYDTEMEMDIIREIYPTLEKTSIDYAIMEKVDPKEVRIIKANDLGWSDIGNWEAIWEELTTTPEETIKRGSVEMLDCKGCLIYGDTKTPVKAIGLEDVVIINTKDGLIVCKKDQSKRIKDLL